MALICKNSKISHKDILLGLKALTLEIECDQTAMDLQPTTSAVFLKGFLVNRGRRGIISDMPLLPLRGESVSVIIIISLLMSSLLGHRSSLWITQGERTITHHAGPVRVSGC
jgi:hypothetical protein